MVVKSAIARPTAGARLPLAACTIEGVAWAGEAGIARVDVSADGGRSWRPAELLGEGERWTWRLWRLDWLPPSPGRFTLIARAWDRDGRAQPFDPRPGELGRYAANAVERVPVTVED